MVVFKIARVETTPIDGQKPGTSGLRKKVRFHSSNSISIFCFVVRNFHADLFRLTDQLVFCQSDLCLIKLLHFDAASDFFETLFLI
jgi:hypothetical protein